MSGVLFRRGMKNSWVLLVVIGAVLAMYIIIITWMFDPEMASVLEEFEQTMPEVMATFGMVAGGAALVDFMAAYLYGMLMQVLPMVFTILAANRLVARLVDGGAMACLLAAPVRRRKIVLTQLLVLLCGIVLVVAFCTGVGLASAELFFPGELDIPGFVLLNAGALALQLCIGGICFFASCLFNESRHALALGAGLPVLGYIIRMAANYGGELEPLRYATFFSLYTPEALLAGDEWALPGIIILAGAGALLCAAGAMVFCKRDVPV